MLVLERFCYGPDATFGRLHLPGHVTVWTLEQAWRGNAIALSCIPEGRYPLVRDHTGRWQWFRIPDGEVPGGRTAIEVHPANTVAELRGCIAPGKRLGAPNGVWGVLESLAACELMAGAVGDVETLWIRQFRPEGMDSRVSDPWTS